MSKSVYRIITKFAHRIYLFAIIGWEWIKTRQNANDAKDSKNSIENGTRF